MSANTESQTNQMDGLKWVITIALLAAAVVGNYIYGDVMVVFRALGVIVLVVLAGIIASRTAKGQTFLNFAKESRTEVRKVVWPSRKEATNTTAIVLVATVIVALLLWGLDGILVRVVGMATGISA
ncbi:preprotein translocase subunit SecE [Aliidiomarina maris]|uniref:Protein translocase subunit SecE n=1 Tax=Aliidiomarina maris TaxID=531312 RepID=A0A327X247_9GAMM|nr:preprotein translocase subunit SecE [Aliidiomarina maris]MBA3989279.1 preprotein translocase subunit SecE [Idiomarina sp.]MCL5255995.1 preprotein translocase subunit SecE [Gammaproteobacteria bacterium]RAJ99204.1 protein translocase subunit secE/sec61 gamma [Aliidiomarina maris]RUO27651.1 preprotein translocase subunit SecE [Aliidiomarina maris]